MSTGTTVCVCILNVSRTLRSLHSGLIGMFGFEKADHYIKWQVWRTAVNMLRYETHHRVLNKVLTVIGLTLSCTEVMSEKCIYRLSRWCVAKVHVLGVRGQPGHIIQARAYTDTHTDQYKRFHRATYPGHPSDSTLSHIQNRVEYVVVLSSSPPLLYPCSLLSYSPFLVSLSPSHVPSLSFSFCLSHTIYFGISLFLKRSFFLSFSLSLSPVIVSLQCSLYLLVHFIC